MKCSGHTAKAVSWRNRSPHYLGMGQAGLVLQQHHSLHLIFLPEDELQLFEKPNLSLRRVAPQLPLKGSNLVSSSNTTNHSLFKALFANPCVLPPTSIFLHLALQGSARLPERCLHSTN